MTEVFQFLAVFGSREDQAGLCDSQGMGERATRDVCVDEGSGRSNAVESGNGKEKLRTVVHQQGHGVASADAQVQEGPGCPVDLLVDFAPGVGAVFKEHSEALSSF